WLSRAAGKRSTIGNEGAPNGKSERSRSPPSGESRSTRFLKQISLLSCSADRSGRGGCPLPVPYVLLSRFLVAADVRAGAHEVSVARSVVDAAHRRPVLGLAEFAQRIGGVLAAVGVRPLLRQHGFRGVRGVGQGIVIPRPLALLDPRDLPA